MWGHHSAEWGNNFCIFGPGLSHGPWFIGWLLPLLFWGTIAYILFSFLKFFFSKKRKKQEDSALEKLRHRFAMGELDQQEYEARKNTLNAR